MKNKLYSEQNSICRAHAMYYRRWNKREVSFLKKNYYKSTISDIVTRLNRSESAIYGKAFCLNLRKERGHSFKKLPSLAQKATKSLAWLIGYLLGDGYLTTSWVIGMKTKDADLKEFYIKTFKDWSKFKGDDFIINQEEKKYNDEKKGKIYTCQKIWVVRVCSKEAWNFLKRFKDCPLYSLNFFPKIYWRLILKGLWDAEGNITPHKGNSRIVVGFSNSNEKILTLYEKICSALAFHPVKVNGDNETTISICSQKEVLDFVDKIGITIKRKRDKAKDRINKLMKKKEIYCEVIKLRKKGLGRKKILDKFKEFLSPGAFDKWVYFGTKPYYIERCKS